MRYAGEALDELNPSKKAWQEMNRNYVPGIGVDSRDIIYPQDSAPGFLENPTEGPLLKDKYIKSFDGGVAMLPPASQQFMDSDVNVMDSLGNIANTFGKSIVNMVTPQEVDRNQFPGRRMGSGTR